jgi:hypothetical protein
MLNRTIPLIPFMLRPSSIHILLRTACLATIVWALFSAHVEAQNNTNSPPSVGQNNAGDLQVTALMNERDFKNCGLEKLTKEERAKLDEWLRQYTLTVMNYTAKGAATAPPRTGVIETQIDGDFEGWTGDTVFKLTNGQVWQQATYAYNYHYAYRPKVMIYKGDSGYMMKVEDVDDAIHVKLLSNP